MKTTSAYTPEEQAAALAKLASLPQRKPLPCIHLGDELRVQAVAAMGLDPRKKWQLCNRGYVAAVCMCKGKRDPWCGPKCPGYETVLPDGTMLDVEDA